MVSEDVDVVFRALDLTGVFANALLGGVIAREHRLDPVGFAVIAVLSGLGGGMIRDVLLQQGPPVALLDYWYLSVALVGALVSYVVNVRGRAWDKAWPWIDAVALGCWACTGSQKALVVGLAWLPSVLLGVITAVGGGATRDVVLRQLPGVFRGNTLYATAAGAGAATLVVLTRMGLGDFSQVLGLVVGAGLCLLARRRGWILPAADEVRRPRLRVPRPVRRKRPLVARPVSRKRRGSSG